MRKQLTSALLAALIFLALSMPALADGIIIPRPRPPEPVIPLRSLAIEYHRVTVTIKDQVATTHVDQVFINESPQEIEGEYIFPLPEGASISQFALWVDGRRLEAEVLEAEKARQIYEEIVRQQRDPALLEYAGRNAFRARIYPIPARGEKRVELEYTEVLPQDHGLVRYIYPLNTEKFSTRPLERVSVVVQIASRQAVKAVYSPSHEVVVVRGDDGSAKVRYEEANVTPNKDFVLYYTVSEEDLGASLLSYKDGQEDGFFLLLLAPKAHLEEQEVVAKDVFIVLDTSGSMRGKKIAQAKEAARYILDNLNPEDRFNIIAFSTQVNAYERSLQPLSKAEVAHSFINALSASGGTNIYQALEETLRQTQAGRPQVILFLTDGLPTEGEVRMDKIIQMVGERAKENVRLFTFGVGYDVNTTLLDAISQAHHGVSSYVRPDEDLEQALSSFYEKISTPVLAEVSLDFGQAQVSDVYPYPLPDLFAGGQLIVVGRYRRGVSTTVTLRGTVNGRPASYAFRDLVFRSSGGEELIPRLWATRKIGHLLMQIRLHGAERELIDEIVELSVRYGIVTPYTSFLVDETEDALSTDGRRGIAERELKAARPQAAPGLGGGEAAPVPTAAAGKAAVERSIAQDALRRAEVPAEAASAQVRTVGDRTFVLREGVWTDTLYDAGKMPAEAVAFASERYFQLLRQYPQWGRYLALGSEVLLVWEGRAYHIGAKGEAPAGGEPTPTMAPRPTPGRAPWQRIVEWWRNLFP